MKDVYTLDDLRDWQAATAEVPLPLRLAVIGDPVAHSRSPGMHNAALEALGIPARYTRLHIRPDELDETLRLLPRAGFIGINVTLPHKAALLPKLTHVDEAAQRIGAVNTVIVGEAGTLHGFNTDGPGFVRAVRADFGVDVRDLRVMVLGAGGGAGRAISVQCAMEGCERLVLVNRTLEKASALASELQPLMASSRLLGPVARLEACAWENGALSRQLENIDLIVNASSVGMKFGDPSPVPAHLLRPAHLVYDSIYTTTRTPLMRAALEAGARTANGLSMLLHQGALSFEIWFQQTAPLEVMRAALA